MPKFKIGVYGSAGGESETVKAALKAEKIGRQIALGGHIVITGACPGLPYAAAEAAYQARGVVWGSSPFHDKKENSRFYPDEDPKIYKKLFFIPKSFKLGRDLEISRKYRNVVSTGTSDAGIIMAGRWGTMHEFCSLHDYGRVIGVLNNSGAFANELPRLLKKISKKTKAKIIFQSNPVKLVDLVVRELRRRKS